MMSDQRHLNENGWNIVGLCRACWAKGFGPTSNQPYTHRQLSQPYEENDIAPTSLVNVGPTKLPTNANVGPTNNCYLVRYTCIKNEGKNNKSIT